MNQHILLWFAPVTLGSVSDRLSDWTRGFAGLGRGRGGWRFKELRMYVRKTVVWGSILRPNVDQEVR